MVSYPFLILVTKGERGENLTCVHLYTYVDNPCLIFNQLKFNFCRPLDNTLNLRNLNRKITIYKYD